MKQEEISLIEQEVLAIVNQSINRFIFEFEKFGITINPIFINKSGDDNSYFSEIEIELWKSNNILIDALSIIIFMEGKSSLKIDEIEPWLQEEFSQILLKQKIK